VASAWRAAAGAGADRLRKAGIAVGLVLLAILAVAGNDRILWYAPRNGLAGNLPFFNFPGPKVWTAAVSEGGYTYEYSSTLISRTALLAFNLAAVWLVTMRPCTGGRRSVLRPLARWSAVGAVGAAMGVAAGWSGVSDMHDSPARNELFAAVTVAFELPATVLLYAYLAQFSLREMKRPGLRTGLAIVCVALPVMVVCSLSGFGLSRPPRGATHVPLVLAACGAYGTVIFAAAASACAMLLSMAGTLVRELALPQREPADAGIAVAV
jgi:hypothetical protein